MSIGKTADDIKPPVPMRPEDDPLEAGNKFTKDARPRFMVPVKHLGEHSRLRRKEDTDGSESSQ